MSWLKESLRAKREKNEMQEKLRVSEEQRRQNKIKETWGKVAEPAYQAIVDWKRLELNRLLADVKESGILGIPDSTSDLNCVFLNRRGEKIICGFGNHGERVGWRVNADFYRAHMYHAYPSIEEALEGEKDSITFVEQKYAPGELSFLYLERYLYDTIHEGDGDTWGSISRSKVFSLRIENAGVFADDTKLGPLVDLRSRRDIERRLDFYLASKISNKNF